MSNLHEIYTHLLFFGVGIIVTILWIHKKYHKAIAENKELKEMMFVAESALMKQNKIYRNVIHGIEKIYKQGCLDCPVSDTCKQSTHSCGDFKIELIIQKIKEINK